MNDRKLRRTFDANDKRLLAMKTLVIAVTVIMVIGYFIAGVAMMSMYKDAAWAGILMWLAGILTAVIFWICAMYSLSLAIDMKLIRNKIYQTENKEMRNILADMCDVDDYDDYDDVDDKEKSTEK